MGVEKQVSKGGGYVGGFLHLFDWNAKSRKKLFSSKSELPEQPKQKKRTDGNLPMTQFHMIDDEDIAARSSIRGSSDYSCASSVTDEDGCGSKAPGVVARLMGLDSLPISNFSETYSTTSFDSQSLRENHYNGQNFEVHQAHQVVYSGPLRNSIEPKPQKMISRPIEKFQTETLPPKSARSIPITHHKLLSPIKSPGFDPSSNAAHIMAAAAKIIESGRQGSSATTGKMPLFGSSSAPLKVRDLKEKVEASRKPSSKLAEASRRPAESNAAKYLKGQSMNKSWNGSFDSKSVEDEYSTYSKSKGKSISLALQAKVNVQKREGLNQGGTRSLFGGKDENDTLTCQLLKSQPNTQRSAHKKPSTQNASSVLRQNNQKQNCLTDRGKLPSKSVPNRKPVAGDSSFGRQKSANKFPTNSKSGSRKMGAETIDSKKELPYSRRKRSIDGDFHLDKNQALENADKGRKVNQSSARGEKQFAWTEESKRNGMDVISFTFTAPMARSTPSPESSREALHDYRGKKVLVNTDGNNGTKLSSLSYNVIGGGDALSTLLEQKLRELTNGVESSRHKAGTAGSSVSIFHDMVPNFRAGSITPLFRDKKSQDQMHIDDSSSHISSGFSSTDFMRKHKPQEVEDAHSSIGNDGDARKLFDHRHPSPISVLEPSFFTESCNSSDTMDSNSTEGCKQSSSVQAQEVLGTSFTELSDSASSSSTTFVSGKQVVGSINWELEYITDILCNIDVMFNDFALGRAQKIINPQLFDELESGRLVAESYRDETKLRRKVLFDCVSECMESRCRVEAKGLVVVKRKEWLAKEVHKEITGWESMGDCMVDELVDKDMSGQCGRWLDFEVETFELGIEIEKRILNSLINEVVADILLL